jgi:hypothetical protein
VPDRLHFTESDAANALIVSDPMALLVGFVLELVPWHPTLGDVDSPEGLAEYQAAKRAHKAEWSKARSPA